MYKRFSCKKNVMNEAVKMYCKRLKMKIRYTTSYCFVGLKFMIYCDCLMWIKKKKIKITNNWKINNIPCHPVIGRMWGWEWTSSGILQNVLLSLQLLIYNVRQGWQGWKSKVLECEPNDYEYPSGVLRELSPSTRYYIEYYTIDTIESIFERHTQNPAEWVLVKICPSPSIHTPTSLRDTNFALKFRYPVKHQY